MFIVKGMIVLMFYESGVCLIYVKCLVCLLVDMKGLKVCV